MTGDATRELDGVLAGVMELGLYRSVGGTQLYGLPGWLVDVLVPSAELCRGEVTAPKSEYAEYVPKESCVEEKERVDVEARDGRTVVVSKAETGEGHSEGGWERDKGVKDDALGNGR